MLRRKILSEADLDRIAEATRLAELKTSGEIVTVITNRAGSYTGHVLLAATVVLFVVSVGYLTLLGPVAALLQRLFWAYDVRHALGVLVFCQAAAFILTYIVLTVWPGLKSLIIPKKDKVDKVRRKAESDFFRHHVAATKGATGVLVYISRFERRVELLVDAGIAAKIKQDTWKSVVDGVIAGIKGPDFVKDLCAQIVRIGETLSKDFPHRADDVNELPNRPVVEVP